MLTPWIDVIARSSLPRTTSPSDDYEYRARELTLNTTRENAPEQRECRLAGRRYEALSMSAIVCRSIFDKIAPCDGATMPSPLAIATLLMRPAVTRFDSYRHAFFLRMACIRRADNRRGDTLRCCCYARCRFILCVASCSCRFFCRCFFIFAFASALIAFLYCARAAPSAPDAAPLAVIRLRCRHMRCCDV